MHTSQSPQQRVAKARATRFPPPMRGRDREGGGDEAPSAKVLLHKDPRSEAAFVGSPITKKCRACCTPLPVPPPHGGRERCGTALPNHRPAFAYRFKDVCIPPPAFAGTNGGMRQSRNQSLHLQTELPDQGRPLGLFPIDVLR